MAERKDLMTELEDILFQSQMLSGVAYVLWDSLAKTESTNENCIRSLAAYFLYEQMEKFTVNFRNRIEQIAERERDEV